MRRMIGAILLAGASALAFLAGGPTARAAQPAAEINVVSNAFQPAAVTISAGGSVTWRVSGGLHTVTSTQPAGLFDSGDMSAGKTFQFKFDRPGTYAYICENHPNAMKATVTVQAAAPQATATPQRTSTAVPVPPTRAAGASNAVAIVNFAFQPGSITVPAGTTVTWTNTGAAPHTVTSDTDGIFDSGRLTTGQRFSFTFNRAGTFAYHCEIHPSMQATITVQGQGGGPAAATSTAGPQRTATAAATSTYGATPTATATVTPSATATATPTAAPIANVGAVAPKKPAGGLQLVLISVAGAVLVIGGLSVAAWRFAGRDGR